MTSNKPVKTEQHQPRTLNKTLLSVVAVTLGLLLAEHAQAAPKSAKISSCPYTITAPGNYTITQDLSCGVTAITILASKVNLSLDGHTISGSGAGDGILVQRAANVSIAHGTIQGFENGVEFQGQGTLDCKVTDLTLGQNSNDGILTRDQTIGLTVMANTANQNGNAGIFLDYDAVGNIVAHNTANQNGFAGIVVGSNFANTVTANTANQNGWGIFLGSAVANTVTHNTTLNNRIEGIHLVDSSGNTVTRNTTDLNGGPGINLEGASSGNIVERNSATANYWGIRIGSNTNGSPMQNTVQDNTITGSPNSGGILLSAGAQQNAVDGNTITLSRVGILIEQGSTGNTIQGNSALTNRDDLEDDNPGCDSNTWTHNKFATDLVAGASDGGPGTGCIR